jgi:glycosyltransferase involved in cell wall biosynthesis
MIVFFLPDLRAGGAERVMLNLLIRYQDHYPNQTIVLLLFKKQGPLLNEIPTSIKIHELGSNGATKSVLSFISFCKLHQPKIVFASLGASLTTSLARPIVSKKTIFINRIGNTIGAEKLLFPNPLKRFFYIFANKIIAKMSDHVIFQCHYMQKDYIEQTKINPKLYSVIYNPVKIDHIKKLAKAENFEKFTFVAVGRLNPQKDYENLISACALLKNKTADFSVAILGQGDLQEKLTDLIQTLELEKNVFLLGHKSNPYSYIKNSKYLISSSLYEGFSNVIIESLCLGKPVIATDCPGGNAEVITNGANGWLCEYKNSEALAKVMLASLNKKVKMTDYEISNYGAKLFSDDTIFMHYVKVFEGCNEKLC